MVLIWYLFLLKNTAIYSKIQKAQRSKKRIIIAKIEDTAIYKKYYFAFAIRRSGVRIPQAPPLKYRIIMRYFYISAFLETH